MKVLIVDDEFVNRLLLKSVMTSYGSVVEAVDGMEAVQFFGDALGKNKPFNLVFLDIMMPNMDGHKALVAMRKLEREYKVSAKKEAAIIMVTSLDTPKDTTQAFRYGGCTDYIVKPVIKDSLISKLRSCRLID